MSATSLRSGPWRPGPRLTGAALLLPAALFLGAFFAAPVVALFAQSVLTQAGNGIVGPPLTWVHYVHFFTTSLYGRVLLTTLRISAVTAVLAAILAYPVALVMVRGNAAVMGIVTVIVLAPLVVSVVVRTYGWTLILGPMHLLYSETAVVIGSLHVFFPMMVLPLASALARMPPAVEEAARTLGGSSFDVFRRVTFPLTLPGLAVGLTLVFSLTASSYVTPVILGGTNGQMLASLIEQQVMTVYDWPFGATLACILVVMVLGINLGVIRTIEGRR